MILKTAFLKQFQKDSGHIVQTGVLPILDYIAIKNGVITKNNIAQLVAADIDVSEDMLIEERALFNFINNTRAEEIQVKITGNRVSLSDGQTTVTASTNNLEHFPVTPTKGFTDINLDAVQCMHIGRGAGVIEATADIPTKTHLFIANGQLIATNGIILYVAAVDGPELVIHKNTATIIGKFQGVNFRESEKYQFVESDQVIFGFSKDECKFYDLSTFAGLDETAPAFTLLKEELLSFNNLAAANMRGKTPSASMDITNGVLTLSMSEPDWELDIERKMDIDAPDHEQFTYNFLEMNKLLKSIPDENLTFYRTHPTRYNIKGADWHGLIMGIQPVVNQ